MSDSSKQNLFREKSLERLSSPERLNELVKVGRSQDLIPLMTFSTVILAGLAWSIWGRIPITVTGRGILLQPYQVLQLQSSASGQLIDLNLDPGSCIEEGDIVAQLDPVELRQQLTQQQQKLLELEQQADSTAQLQQQRTEVETQEIQALKATLQQQLNNAEALTPELREKARVALVQERETLESRLANAHSLEQVFKERLSTREELRQQGVLSADQLLESDLSLRQQQQEVATIETQLKTLDRRETEAEQQYLTNLTAISQIQSQLQQLETRSKRLEQENLATTNNQQNQINEVKRQITQLEQQIDLNSQVSSLYSGCIKQITAQIGQFAHPGDPLALVEVPSIAIPIEDISVLPTQASSMIGVTYFGVDRGKRIEEGMQAQITPDTVQRERFGSIVAEVVQVSDLPVTEAGVRTLVGNPDVARSLLAQGQPTIQVVALLFVDNTTPSGLKWSASKGPDSEITAGTTINVHVLVEQRAPITFVLPILREISGFS